MTMEISQNGLKFTSSNEALRLNPYNDQRGFATVGYGHLIRRGPVQPTDQPITIEQALEYLHTDLIVPESVVNNLITAEINQNQFDALVDFVYNIGAGEFAKSSVHQYLNQGNFPLAQIYMKKYIYAGGEVSQGLVNRRSKEIALFNEPVTQ